MRVFLDANILFSASKKDSLLSTFLEIIKKKKITLVTNLYAVDEARRNLQIHYPDRSSLFKKQIKKIEITHALQLSTTLDKNINLADKDLPILLGAIASGCNYLLTGDKRDFGHLFGKVVGVTKIVTPRMLADELGVK